MGFARDDEFVANEEVLINRFSYQCDKKSINET